MGVHLCANRREEVAGALYGTAGLGLGDHIWGIIGQMAEGQMPSEHLTEPFGIPFALVDQPPDKFRLHKRVPP
jgi:hypothetical protein